ncbi:MAG: hypothetical protein KKA81_07265 [Bacteroidetes bacterium]|nr:hypothetical protein [Bacteroidota bacterium]
MKKILLIFIVLAFIMPVFSQEETLPDNNVSRSLEEFGLMHVTDLCGDFTITDSDGVTWNLYEQLDLGKTVFLDLFFTT